MTQNSLNEGLGGTLPSWHHLPCLAVHEPLLWAPDQFCFGFCFSWAHFASWVHRIFFSTRMGVDKIFQEHWGGPGQKVGTDVQWCAGSKVCAFRHVVDDSRGRKLRRAVQELPRGAVISLSFQFCFLLQIAQAKMPQNKLVFFPQLFVCFVYPSLPQCK